MQYLIEEHAKMANERLPFHHLDWMQFERLANDVVSMIHEIPIKEFPTGRDGGVDGSFRGNIKMGAATEWDKYVIVQTKFTHKENDKMTKAKADRLFKDEIIKVRTLKCCILIFYIIRWFLGSLDSLPVSLLNFLHHKFQLHYEFHYAAHTQLFVVLNVCFLV